MVIAQFDGIARAAGLAVEEVLAAAHPADPALFAVELLLCQVVVVEVADGAKVLPEAVAAAGAAGAGGCCGVAHASQTTLRTWCRFMQCFACGSRSFSDFAVSWQKRQLNSSVAARSA